VILSGGTGASATPRGRRSGAATTKATNTYGWPRGACALQDGWGASLLLLAMPEGEEEGEEDKERRGRRRGKEEDG